MLEPDVCLDNVLCFRHRRRVARDNTVMYRWRTLQLLPGMERPTYAGAVVEVLEGLARIHRRRALGTALEEARGCPMNLG